MLADDLSVQIKLIIMYAIGVLALLTLLFFLYRKHQSFKNKYVATILGINPNRCKYIALKKDVHYDERLFCLV